MCIKHEVCHCDTANVSQNLTSAFNPQATFQAQVPFHNHQAIDTPFTYYVVVLVKKIKV